MDCCRLLVLTLLLVGLSSHTHCLEWGDSLSDDALLSVCAGDDVTFSWSFQPEANEIIEDIKWEYEENSTSKLIAFHSSGLSAPSESYAKRVTCESTGSLTMTDVTLKDSGMYSVRVEARNQDGVSRYQRSVFLQVNESVLTGDGKVHVREEGGRRWSKHAPSATLTLSCGTFRFTEHTPPLQVQWTSPSGEKLVSTNYNNGRFYLNLPTPVEGGTYTCHIPPEHLSDACIPHSAYSNDSVRVDSVQINLLHAYLEQKTLKAEDGKLNERIAHLNTSEEQLKAEVEKLKAENAELQAEAEKIRTQNTRLDSEVSKLREEDGKLKEELKNLVSGIKLAIVNCPHLWTLEGESCYKYVGQPRTWLDAQAECEGWGGSLVEVDTRAENSFVFRMVQSNGADMAWLGLNDIREEGRYLLPSGRPPTFTMWHRGEPNDSGGREDCAMYWPAKSSFGDRWNDAPCNTKCTFVCERRTLF